VRLLHDWPGRLFGLVVLGRGGSDDVASELVDQVAQVFLFLGQIKVDR